MFRFSLRRGWSVFQIVFARFVFFNFFRSRFCCLLRISIGVAIDVKLGVRSSTFEMMLVGRVRRVMRLIFQGLFLRFLERVVPSRLSNLFVVNIVWRGVIFRSRGRVFLVGMCCGGFSAFSAGTNLPATPAYLSAGSPFLGGEAMKVLQVPGSTNESLFSSASRLPVVAFPSCSLTDSSVVKPAVLRKPRRKTRGSVAANSPSTEVSLGLLSMVSGTVFCGCWLLIVGCLSLLYNGSGRFV